MKLFKESAIVAVMAVVMFGLSMVSAHAGCGKQVTSWGGITWGEDYESVKDLLVLIEQHSATLDDGTLAEIKIYYRKGYEVPADLGIEQPYFIFLNGKFASSYIPINSSDGFIALAAKFLEVCGEPEIEKETSIGWKDEVTVVYMALDDVTGAGCIVGSPLGVLATAEVIHLLENEKDL